jgi:hypothetical protein
MTYSPPGVRTIVEISNTTVTLPGGTRILALIGNGARTVTTNSEVQVQGGDLTVTVNNSGINTINSIYDYSGPGNSKYNYVASGSTVSYGAGYYILGNDESIGWTPAVNPYPTSVAPALGSTFFATYTFSGAAIVSELKTTAAAIVSGVGNLLNFANVQDISVVSGVDFTYPAYPNISGAGYYVSGNTLKWNEGTYATYALAQEDGAVVSGSTNIYVSYTYSGSTTQSLLNSSYSNTLAQSGTASIVAVSGVGITYYPSGTINPNYPTSLDTNGYGVSGTGFSLASGATLNWAQALNNGFPYAYVPVSGSTLYITYEYTKTQANGDFAPKTFVDQDSIISTYGPAANWFFNETGTLAGQWSLINVNPLTLAAQIAFNNNASVLVMVQNEGAGISAGDYFNALQLITTKTIDLIVPLTVGSGITLFDMEVSEKASALNFLRLHCETTSNTINKKERVGLGSLGVADVGDDTTEDTYIFTAKALNDKRISLIAPGACSIQLQDPYSNFHTVTIDGAFLAVAVAALSASPLSDVATPLTNQSINEIVGLDASSPGLQTTVPHTDTSYLEVEKNNMAAAGVMVINQEGPNIYVRHQLTTDQSNVIVGEFSVVTLVDYVSQATRAACKGFIGQKLRPNSTPNAVKGTILAVLGQLSASDIISSIGDITVKINPNNPTELLVSVAYVPIFPLNYITVTFTIQTLG